MKTVRFFFKGEVIKTFQSNAAYRAGARFFVGDFFYEVVTVKNEGDDVAVELKRV